MWLSALQGFAIGGSLIIAIGGQNAYVIQQGVRGRRVFLVATICFLSDALLISAGAGGVGTLIAQNLLLRQVAAWGGALFLFVYGAKSAHGVFFPDPDIADDVTPSGNGDLKRIIATTLALTYLNPHVYLDTVVLLGGIAAQYEAAERLTFTIGAIIASLLWFYGLAITARQVAPFFRTELGARVLDGIVWAVMWVVAGSLVIGELSG
jgi:L-lysine exporter family protein LysE/ArgO